MIYDMTWRRTASKGYGFTHFIPCRIVKRSPARVQIAALLRDGTERFHWTKPEALCVAKVATVTDPTATRSMSAEGSAARAALGGGK